MWSPRLLCLTIGVAIAQSVLEAADGHAGHDSTICRVHRLGSRGHVDALPQHERPGHEHQACRRGLQFFARHLLRAQRPLAVDEVPTLMVVTQVNSSRDIGIDGMPGVSRTGTKGRGGERERRVKEMSWDVRCTPIARTRVPQKKQDTPPIFRAPAR